MVWQCPQIDQFNGFLLNVHLIIDTYLRHFFQMEFRSSDHKKHQTEKIPSKIFRLIIHQNKSEKDLILVCFGISLSQ